MTEVVQFRKGNIIFLKSLMMDFIYIVHCQKEGGKIVARKIDAPPEKLEELNLNQVVRLAEEQERLLPPDITGTIEKQRQITFTATSKKKGKGLTEKQIEKRLKGMSKESLDDILKTLGEIGERALANSEREEEDE